MTDSLSLIPTRSSQLKNGASKSFQAVVYETHKGKDNTKVSLLQKNVIEKRDEMDMKKVRFEVFKFGMSGFNSQKKAETKVALAIKLGAMPSRNKFLNYKDFKVIRQNQLKEETEELKLLKVGKTSKGTANNIKGKKKALAAKRKKVKDAILDQYGKPGEVSFDAKRRKW